MLTTSRSTFSPAFDWLGEALLSWASLRAGLARRPSIERLPDHLRRDVGLPPRVDGPSDPRDWRR